MRIKHDVDLHPLQPQMVLAMIVAESVYAKSQSEVMITSGKEGPHMVKSLHFTGMALDIRLPNMAVNQVAANLAAALGPQYDVVLEGDHIHIEYDPKRVT